MTAPILRRILRRSPPLTAETRPLSDAELDNIDPDGPRHYETITLSAATMRLILTELRRDR